MKPFVLICFIVVFISLGIAQPAKKTGVSKPVESTSPVVKAAFLKRNFLLDPAVFSENSITDRSNGIKELKIKLRHLKTASISFTDASASSKRETTADLQNNFGTYSVQPDAAGFTYELIYINTTILMYNGQSIEPLEYKCVYHGTKEQQALAASINKMLPKQKRVNEYSTDENNRIMRIYLLNNTPDKDKGYMMLFYDANSGEDKTNDGSKILQELVDGISPMKINDYISFSKINASKFNFDFALPDSAKENNGMYSFSKPSGTLFLTKIADASGGYAALTEAYSPNYGTIQEKGPVEKHSLYNGINIFTCLFTILSPGQYKTLYYVRVNVLVADKKIIKAPLQIVLQSFSSDLAEFNKLNTFILNSISLPGNLTKASIKLVKEEYKNSDAITPHKEIVPQKPITKTTAEITTKKESGSNNPITSTDKSYSETKTFSEGMAVVINNNKKYGYINESNQVVIPLIYDYASEFKEGLGAVNVGEPGYINEHYGFVDKAGKVIIPLMYEKTGFWFSEGCVQMMLHGKWGFVDTKNKTIVPFIYEEAVGFHEGFAAIKLNGKWGYVNKSGKVTISLKYDRTFRFSNGIASVKLNGKWGYINTEGEEIIAPVYDDVYWYKDGKAKVVLNGKNIIVDKTGKEVIE